MPLLKRLSLYPLPRRAMVRRQRRAFTLIEVLVASGAAVLLGLVVVAIFVQSAKTLTQVEGRVEMVQTSRVILNRLQQVISCGVSIPGEDTVPYPEQNQIQNERGQNIVPDDPTTWCRYVVIRTTEDFLRRDDDEDFEEDFNPNEIYDLPTMPAIDQANILAEHRTDAQNVYDYIIWWEDSSNGGLNILPNEDRVMVIGRVKPLQHPTSFDVLFRPDGWASGTPFNDLDEDSSGRPTIRILGRGGRDVSFFRHDSSGIQISILSEKTVQSQIGSQNKQFRLDGMIHIPAEVTL